MTEKKTNNFTDYDRIDPHNEQLEKTILGTIITDQDSLHDFFKFTKGTNVFYFDHHKKIFEAIKELYEKNSPVDIITLPHVLDRKKELGIIGGVSYVMDLTKTYAYVNHKEHCYSLIGLYILRELIALGHDIQTKSHNLVTIDEIKEHIYLKLDEVSIFDDKAHSKGIKDIVNSFIEDIQSTKEGEEAYFFRTGDKLFDEVMALSPRQLLLVAGDKGCGKSKFVRNLCRKFLKYDPNIAMLFYTMEEKDVDFVVETVGNELKLSSRKINRMGNSLSKEESNKIIASATKLKKYNIEIVDSITPIISMRNGVKKFAKKHNDKKLIVVIDNWGLVDVKLKLSETEKDNFLAREVMQMRDETNALIIIVHHTNKELISKENAMTGYRPTEAFVRGSSRIIDYVNKSLLVNYPSKYTDLVLEEKMKWEKEPEDNAYADMEMSRSNFDKLWGLNPTSDKDTLNYNNLYEKTYDELIKVCDTKFDPSGNPMAIGYIYKKYKEYVRYWNVKNIDRPARFKDSKIAILTFIFKNMWYQSWNKDVTNRDFYLYGDSRDNEGVIEKLFIAEPTKNRDYKNGMILRYFVDLGFSDFNEWN